MDAQRWSNILTVARSYRSGHPRAGRGPREAWIEAAEPASRPPRWLPPELFARLEPLFSTVERVHLVDPGVPEPNPHLGDYVLRMEAAGVEVRRVPGGALAVLGRAADLAAPSTAAPRAAVAPEAGNGDRPRLPRPCSEPWSTIYVSASGEVRTCCFNRAVLGHLGESEPGEIWRGEAFARLRRLHAARRPPDGCTGCISRGGVLRSPYLALERSLPSPARNNGRGCLDDPRDLEIAADPLVVTGRLPLRVLNGSPVQPEIFLDGHLIASGRGEVTVQGDRFAAVLSVPSAAEGSHRLAVRAADEAGGEVWGERQILLARWPVTGEIAGVCRAAFAVELEREEWRPRLFVGDRKQPLAGWVCGRWGHGWRGVGVVDLTRLAPGTWELELRPRHQPPHRLCLHRLEVEGAFGSALPH